LLLFHDRRARHTYDHRIGPDARVAAAGTKRRVFIAILFAPRGDGPVLALRGRRLDLSISVAVFGRGTLLMAVPHIVPVKTYVLVFIALLLLAGLTTGVAFIDLGAFNTPIAMAIAFVKMMLVLLVFMHLLYSAQLTRIA